MKRKKTFGDTIRSRSEGKPSAAKLRVNPNASRPSNAEKKHVFDKWSDKVDKLELTTSIGEARHTCWRELKHANVEGGDNERFYAFVLDPLFTCWEPNVGATIQAHKELFTNIARVYGQEIGNVPAKRGPRRNVFRGVNEWQLKDRIISSMADAGVSDLRLKIERDQKYGPCDYGGYESLVPTLVKQYTPSLFNGDMDVLRQAVRRVVNELYPCVELPLLTIEQSMAKLEANTDFETNSGWPFYKETSKLTEAEFNFHEVMAQIVVDGRGDELLDAPCVLFKRVQMGRKTDDGYAAKNRAVMGVPMFSKIVGGMFWYALFDRMRDFDRYASYLGNHCLEPVADRALSSDYTVSLDYGNYDTTITTIFECLFDELIEKFPNARGILTWEKQYYFHAPLIVPTGILRGRHGLFSGLIGTSFGGSLVNAILVEYLAIRANNDGIPITINAHCTMGDDTLLGLNCAGGSITFDYVCETLSETGVDITRDIDKQMWYGPDKDKKDRCAVFLSRYWHGDRLKPEFSIIRCLGNILWGEQLTIEETILMGARLSIDECEHDSILGPILMRTVASLTNIEHHPFMVPFVSTVTAHSPHLLRPSSWMNLHSLLRVYGAHVDFEDIGYRGLESNPVVHIICNTYDSLITDFVIQRDNVFYGDISALADLADSIAQCEREARKGDSEGVSKKELFDSIMASDLSEGVKKSLIQKAGGLL